MKNNLILIENETVNEYLEELQSERLIECHIPAKKSFRQWGNVYVSVEGTKEERIEKI